MKLNILHLKRKIDTIGDEESSKKQKDVDEFQIPPNHKKQSLLLKVLGSHTFVDFFKDQ